MLDAATGGFGARLGSGGNQPLVDLHKRLEGRCELKACFRKDGHCEEMRGTFRQNDSYIQSSIANDLTMRKVGYC